MIRKIQNGRHNIKVFTEIDCFDLCDIIREKLTGYADTINLHIMNFNDGSGAMIGCMWF